MIPDVAAGDVEERENEKRSEVKVRRDSRIMKLLTLHKHAQLLLI